MINAQMHFAGIRPRSGAAPPPQKVGSSSLKSVVSGRLCDCVISVPCCKNGAINMVRYCGTATTDLHLLYVPCSTLAGVVLQPLSSTMITALKYSVAVK